MISNSYLTFDFSHKKLFQSIISNNKATRSRANLTILCVNSSISKENPKTIEDKTGGSLVHEHGEGINKTKEDFST